MPILYHLSPESFDSFDTGCMGNMCNRASTRVGERGIFLAPNFRDMLRWVGTIAYTKGHKSKEQGSKRKKLLREYEREEREYPNIHPPENQSLYKTLFLYKVEIKPDILRKIKDHNRKFNENTVGLYEAIGSWDAEFFVPEELLPYIEIVGKKKYKTMDLLNQATHENMRPRSEGYENYVRSGFENKEQEPEEKKDDYTEVFEARKQFDKEFKKGDHVLIDGVSYTVSSNIARNVYLVPVQGYRQISIDILEFMEKVIKRDDSDITSGMENSIKKCSQSRWYLSGKGIYIL